MHACLEFSSLQVSISDPQKVALDTNKLCEYHVRARQKLAFLEQ